LIAQKVDPTLARKMLARMGRPSGEFPEEPVCAACRHEIPRLRGGSASPILRCARDDRGV